MSEKVGATTFTKTSDGLTELIGDTLYITQGPNTLTGNTFINGNLEVNGGFSFQGILGLRNDIGASLDLEMRNTPNNRGLIRTSSDAFGLDIETQGTGKSIKLTSDQIMISSDNTSITNLNADTSLGISEGGFKFNLDASTIATNYTLYLPSTQGASGQILGNAGGGILQWVNDSTGPGGTVTSVNLTAPSFLSVSGAPITSTGTIALSYSGTPLPIANGGTGTTTSTGTGSLVLSSNAVVSNFSLGNSSATSLLLNSAVSLTASSGSWTLVLPTSAGSAGQALVTDGTGVTSWSSLPTVPITSVGLTAPSFLTVTGSPLTSSGTIALSYSGTPLPVLNGGTGTTTSTGTGSVVLSNNPTLTNISTNKITTQEITAPSPLFQYTGTPLPAITTPSTEVIPVQVNDLNITTFNPVVGDDPPASLFPTGLGGNITISTGKWVWDNANTRPTLSKSLLATGFTAYTSTLTSGTGTTCSFTLSDSSMFTLFTRFSVVGFSQYVGTYYVLNNNGTTIIAKGTATGTPTGTVILNRANNYVQPATSITGNGITITVVTPNGNNLFENFQGFYISGGGMFEGGYTVIGGDENQIIASSGIVGTETSNIYVGKDNIDESYSGQINVLSAQDLTLGSIQTVNIDALDSIKLKGDESVTIESIGVASVSATGAIAVTSTTGSVAITTLLGSINFTGTNVSTRSPTIDNFAYLPEPAADFATMRNFSTGSMVVGTCNDVFIVTEPIAFPTAVAVVPPFGNIFIECKSLYGGIKIRSSPGGPASICGGTVDGTRIGYNDLLEVPRGPTTIRGTETTIESYAGDIYIDSQTSVTLESNTDTTLKTGGLGNVVFDTTSIKSSGDFLPIKDSIQISVLAN